MYLGKLTTIPKAASEPYWQSYVIIIVRDGRPADVLFQCSDNNWGSVGKTHFSGNLSALEPCNSCPA